MRDKLTLWQRAVLAIMYAVERERDIDDIHSVSRSIVQFPRRSLEALLEFDWQGYHTAAMKELSEQGWIIIRLKSGRTVGYVLTEAASVHLWQKHIQATADALPVSHEEMESPF